MIMSTQEVHVLKIKQIQKHWDTVVLKVQPSVIKCRVTLSWYPYRKVLIAVILDLFLVTLHKQVTCVEVSTRRLKVLVLVSLYLTFFFPLLLSVRTLTTAAS